MPTYDLTCDECGNRFERFFTRLLRDEDKVCPACGSAEVRQGVGGGYCAPSKASIEAPCVPKGGFS